MLAYINLVAVLLGVETIYNVLCFAKHLRAARRSGLPYTWSPVLELGTLAFFTDAFLRWYYREYLQLGKGWPRWARFLVKDWYYEDRRRAAREYGSCFLVVSPGGLTCYISDASAASRLATRRKAFIKVAERMKILNPFGENVVSVEGDVWKFHLSITLPPLAADSVVRLVWDEASRQVDMMAAAWRPEDSHRERIYALTLNTMSLVGFGHRAEWGKGHEAADIPSGHRYSLVATLTHVVSNLPQIMLLPRWLLPWTPWPLAYHAANEMEQYIDEMMAVERERLRLGGGEADRETILTAVLRTNIAAEREKGNTKGVGRTTLTDREIRGNIFVLLVAGYDTTANTLLFSNLVLALYKDLQDNVLAEIDAVYEQAEREGRSELSYTHDYPRFRYLVAFMYEVMRMFPIVQTISRVTAGEQELRLGQGSESGDNEPSARRHVLPDGAHVMTDTVGIHYDPAIWPSPEAIEPRRWLLADPHSWDPAQPLTAAQQAEIDDKVATIPGHRKGTFLTFGEGPRACLGRGFARVEFVAIISRLLRSHRIEVADADPSVAARALRTLRLRSGSGPITLVPPEDVRLRLVPRKQERRRV